MDKRSSRDLIRKVYHILKPSERFPVNMGNERSEEIIMTKIIALIMALVLCLSGCSFNSSKEEPKEVERPLRSKDFKECVNEFDYQFVSKIENYDELKNLILSANFLNIKPLINLLSANIAHKIKGINTSTIRNTFNIKELNKQEQKQFDEDKAIIEKKEF